MLENDLAQKAKEVADWNQVLKHRDEKLAEAQKAQAELMKKQRELDDARRELEITVENWVQESFAPLREKAAAEIEERYRLKIAERDEKEASPQPKVEELQKKLHQDSQQLQGEVLELELESLLRGRFPYGVIEPVAKGEFGGDVLQRVVTPFGHGEDLAKERAMTTKQWAKREQQIRGVIDTTVGMYGHLPGIAAARWGKSKTWKMPLLEANGVRSV